MKRKAGITILLLALGLAVALIGMQGIASTQGNVVIQVCIALDGSGSVSPTEFALQVTGLANAIEDPTVIPQDGSVEISVVQFGTYDLNGARVEVPATVIDSPAVAASAGATIRAMVQGGNGTPMAAGIELCTAQITSSPHFTGATKQAINVSTDGAPDSRAAALAARDAAVATGIDELDAEAVGSNADVHFLAKLVYPQPAVIVPPGSYSPGFVRIIGTYADFGEAMREKLGEVIQPSPTPEPTPEEPSPTPEPTPEEPEPTLEPTPDEPGPTPEPTLDEPGPPSGTIRGTVFEDCNRDGVRQPDERPLVGVTFSVRSPGGALFDGWTGGDGTYGPTALSPSDYWIDLHVPPGYTPTTPTTRGPIAINGSVVTGQDFGLTGPNCAAPATPTPAMSPTTGTAVAAPPILLPVAGGSGNSQGALVILLGLIVLTVGLWCGRRGGV